MEAAHADLTQKVTAEQESFLRRFQNTMSGAMDAGVAEANQKVQAEFGPLPDAWKSITQNQQAELRGLYARIGEHDAITSRGRVDNGCNQWKLHTVASIDHQTRNVVTDIAAPAPENQR